ncbi:hypothetical protein D3C72_1449860 [compost metagenome]
MASGPADRPTQATNTASPRSFSNCTAWPGMCPIAGRLALIQPQTRPLTSAPPPLPSDTGMPHSRAPRLPSIRPARMPNARNTRSVTPLRRSSFPSAAPPSDSSGSAPTSVTRSPYWTTVAGVSGSTCPERTMDCRNTPRARRAPGRLASSPTVRPLMDFLLTMTCSSLNWRSSACASGSWISGPITDPARSAKRRRPSTTTTSPVASRSSGVASTASPLRRMRLITVRPPSCVSTSATRLPSASLTTWARPTRRGSVGRFCSSPSPGVAPSFSSSALDASRRLMRRSAGATWLVKKTMLIRPTR